MFGIDLVRRAGTSVTLRVDGHDRDHAALARMGLAAGPHDFWLTLAPPLPDVLARNGGPLAPSRPPWMEGGAARAAGG